MNSEARHRLGQGMARAPWGGDALPRPSELVQAQATDYGLESALWCIAGMALGVLIGVAL